MEWLKKEKVKLVTLTHPKSTISKFSSLGIGTCVMANAVVNAGTLIKDGVIIEFKYSSGDEELFTPYRIRDDKDKPNGEITVINTLKNIEESIDITDFN